MNENNQRYDTTTNHMEINDIADGKWVRMTDGLHPGHIVEFHTQDAFDEHMEMLARNFTWSDKADKDAVKEQLEQLRNPLSVANLSEQIKTIRDHHWNPIEGFPMPDKKIEVLEEVIDSNGMSRKLIKEPPAPKWGDKPNITIGKTQSIGGAINPAHYQGFVKDMQWLEVMSHIPQFKDPENFKAAVLLQIHKYLSRLDRKDSGLQELRKLRWYTNYLIAYIENDNKPVEISKIKELTNG
jgi:hypothetical protein